MAPKRRPSDSRPHKSLEVKRKRTRNGCLTCRDRHLKCDESFPICNNCVKSKRQCLRGIRLKFLNTTVHHVSPNMFNRKVPAKFAMLDQSIVTASHYRDGVKTYERWINLHSASDLKKAEIDFDRYFDVSFSLEEPHTKRLKLKNKQTPRPNSVHFKNLLDEFLKFESEDFDKELEAESSLIMTKFNYFDPPLGFELYLKDIKVLKKNGHNSRESSEETIPTWENNLDDYYIFDSDEEEDNLTNKSTDFEDLYAGPITDSDSIREAKAYLEGCRWLLNTVTDTQICDFWLNRILLERTIQGDEILKGFFQKYGIFRKEVESPGIEILDNKLANLQPNVTLEVYCLVSILLITGLFQKLCHEKASLEEVMHFIRKSETTLTQLPQDLESAEFSRLCFSLTFALSVWTSMISDSKTALDPFVVESKLDCRAVSIEPEAIHAVVKLRFESKFEFDYDDDLVSEESGDDYEMSANDDYDLDDNGTASSSKSRLREYRFTDTTYLIALLLMMGKIQWIVKEQHNLPQQKKLDQWQSVMKDLKKFETNFPFVLSPFSICPLNNQAVQGLVVMGFSEDTPVAEFACDPPFPEMKWSSEMGLIIITLHHSLYLYLEKSKPEGLPSFFDSKDFLNFKVIMKYNEVIPHETDSKEREILHMARRLVSCFLSFRNLNGSHEDKIWEFCKWCFELGKEFLTEDDIKALDKRLAK